MNIEFLTKNLGTDNLEQYIIDEYTKGKQEAELLLEEAILKSNEEINKIESEEGKVLNVISLIVDAKKSIDLSYNNELHLIKKKAKEFAANTSIDISAEKEELQNFANYYIAFFKFQKTQQALLYFKLKDLGKSSRKMHLQAGIISKLNYYFDILNDTCKIDSFTWSWETFEDGLIKQFQKFSLDNFNSKIDHKYEIKNLKREADYQINDLKDDRKELASEIIRLERQIELRDNFLDKYYSKSDVLVKNTYFGDNLPFIFNLYNFLKSNNLLPTGWSYFYSCMILGNKEIIFLKPTKNLKFVGRVFYHLRDFLILHFKDESENFIRNKFYVNEEPLSPHFFANHVYKKVDKELNPFIAEIDVFFEKQKEIYSKS